jgi:hypothetical protein
MEYLVKHTNMPMVLHGGTGPEHRGLRTLIALGAAKVNISTQLKKTYADGFRTYLEKNPTQYDPLKLIGAVQNDVTEMAKDSSRRSAAKGRHEPRPDLRLRRRAADTERDGHLVAFNQMWREQGVNWQWTVDQYAEKLKIGGGKERIASLARDADFRAAFAGAGRRTRPGMAIVAEWHKRKSEIFKELVMSGAMPGRPGVKRLTQDALDQGGRSPSARRRRRPRCRPCSTAWWARICRPFAGSLPETSSRRRSRRRTSTTTPPTPRARARRLLVVEDSRNGLQSATAAGMTCVDHLQRRSRRPRTSPKRRSWSAAWAIRVTGDRCGESLAGSPSGLVTVADLEAVLAGATGQVSRNHSPSRRGHHGGHEHRSHRTVRSNDRGRRDAKREILRRSRRRLRRR